MADLGVGPKQELMVADDPLCCSKLSRYPRKETLLIFIPLYLKKKINNKTAWQRVSMQGMGRHTASFVGMADRLN